MVTTMKTRSERLSAVDVKNVAGHKVVRQQKRRGMAQIHRLAGASRGQRFTKADKHALGPLGAHPSRDRRGARECRANAVDAQPRPQILRQALCEALLGSWRVYFADFCSLRKPPTT